MEYYINPSWIYWISVADSLKTFFIVLMIGSGTCAIVALSLITEDIIEENTFKKLEIINFIIFIVSLLAITFIPSKEVLVEMEVAKLATKQNVDLTVESLKDIVNYIVNAIARLK